MRTIAYLAPEIPALSATFVYNEILALEKQGYNVIPISVHLPGNLAGDERLQDLATRTIYLYQDGLKGFLASAFHFLTSSPSLFFAALSVAGKDAWHIGIFKRTSFGIFFRFLASCKVASFLLRYKCDHIHAHFAHVPTDIAMYAASLANVPFSFTAHANDIFEREWLLTEKVGRAKFVATISSFNRDFIVSRGGKREKIHVIRCGIDSQRFVPAPLRPIIPPYNVGSIGRMVEKKGYDTLLHASKIMKDSGIDFRLILVGSGPQEQYLRELTVQLGVSGIVQFPGPLPNDAVSDWLKTLDLFVLPCRKDTNGDMDGIPVVLMEAMASGIPVVSTSISGIPELVKHEQTGLLAPPQTPDSLAKAMIWLLYDNELREHVYRTAIQRVGTEFDDEVNIQRLIRLFA